MHSRSEAITDFISQAGWGDAARSFLAGDASNRRYERLSLQSGATAILMDAPPSKGEDIRPFVQIAQFLSSAGLSAPQILAKDADLGALILEDLGNSIFARVLEKQPDLETRLYEVAIDVLVHLHKQKPPALAAYDVQTMTPLALLAVDWYAAHSGNLVPKSQRGVLVAELETVLAEHAPPQNVLIQRDYHAENLLWLPGRSDVARVGLLDFQDAMIGHRAYDLVSLLNDARRDVPSDLAYSMTDRYIQATGIDPISFGAACAALGVQRNLRILGVFARLSVHFGKPSYVELIPRVWRYLQTDLQHPALTKLHKVVTQCLPTPTPEILETLKAKCGTVPHL